MEFWRSVLKFLDSKMTEPQMYGWFHILFFVLSFATAALLCFLYKKGYIKNIRKVVFITALIVLILEVYKMINFGFSYEDRIKYEFPWSAFPWQFCSMPMYIGLLAGLTKGKVHDSFVAFLRHLRCLRGLRSCYIQARCS